MRKYLHRDGAPGAPLVYGVTRGLTRHGIRLSAIAAILGCIVAASSSRAQNYESHVVTIDVSSPYPVPTGFIPADSTGDVIILAEGNIRVLDMSTRFDRGWFGPNGSTRLERFGQPVADGMPFGALIGGFSTNVANYRFVGRIGAFPLSAAFVGREFNLALNMTPADFALLEGQVTVTVIYVAEGWADQNQFEVTEGTTLPVATGMIAGLNDQFVILPYGMLNTNISLINYTGGSFAPDGLPSFNRAGQPYSEGPYGGLYAHFGNPANGFYLGDGGMWRITGAAGQELRLTLNLNPADLVGSDGNFIVNVIRIPQ